VCWSFLARAALPFLQQQVCLAMTPLLQHMYIS
jgi:hypothetical protein